MAPCPGTGARSLLTRHLLGTGPILGEAGRAPFYSPHVGFVYRLCCFLPGPSRCWRVALASARLRMQNKWGGALFLQKTGTSFAEPRPGTEKAGVRKQ